LTLIPSVRKVTKLPLLAAGGISSGESVLAAMVLGADGVQIGSRFAISEESSAHTGFKKLVCEIGEGATKLALKKLTPVRLVKNHFFEQVNGAEQKGATVERLLELLGKGRAKKGMFEGDLENGELEIGQVSAQINQVLPVRQIMENLISEYRSEREGLIAGGKYNF
jgi:enoyl-[acyl-carrier protein] reductase II